MKKTRMNVLFWTKFRSSGVKALSMLLVVICTIGLGQSRAENKSSERTLAQQQAEQVKVTGTITDNKGAGMPGVNVVVKGTTTGVGTDAYGKYTIDVNKGQTLEFSFVGMVTQTIVVGSKNVINVMMQEDVSELDEVAVVAFGKQKKSSIVSSITTVRPKDLKVPSSNLTTALAGRIAGVIAYQRSGEPGEDNASFFIRGITTFGTGKADPLILIDNVEMSSDDLSRLNTDDIESFSVLKDATATSLYGARGANGVILVMTKEGKEGKATVSVRFENSFSASTRNFEIADPYIYMDMHNEAVRTRDPLGILPYSNQKIAMTKAKANPYAFPAVDWKEALLKDVTSNQRLNVNLSGGGKIARYYIAASYYRDNGILKVDPINNFNTNIELDKYLVRSNININVTPSTEMIVRVHGTFDDYTGPLDGGTRLYEKAIAANPVLFPAYYLPDETFQYTNHILFGNSGNKGDYLNPYADMVKGYKNYSNTVVLAQLELKQDLNMLTKGLNVRLLANTIRNSFFDVRRSYIPYYYSIGSYDAVKNTYRLAELNGKGDGHGEEYLSYNPGDKTVNSTLYMELAASYNRTFNEKHGVSGMLVFIGRESLTGNAGSLQRSLPARNLGLSGRFTYAYADRYFGEVNFGYNGSERFDENHRWGFFPSVGMGWMVSNEDFWQNGGISAIVTKLKLKGTYGMVGNDAIGSDNDRFFYLSEVNMDDAGRGAYFGYEFNEGQSGVSISRYADSKIGWEVSYKTNIGAEINLFNKLEIQADYFQERRTKILQQRVDIPSTMGLQARPSANIGEARGRGFDMSVDYSHIINQDWWTTVRGNFTWASSKFEKYEEVNYDETPWRYHKGQNISQQFGYVAERMFIDDEEVANSPKQQFGEYMGGDLKYKDINKDGYVDERDQVPIGFPTTPEIIYGFGLSVGYKDFDFSCFFQGSARSSFWIDPRKVAPFIDRSQTRSPAWEGKKENNALAEFIADSHWSEENRDLYAAWPRLSTYTIENNVQRNTWFMRNGSFLRLKSAEIGYSLPKSICERIRMKQLRVYVSGTNLLTFSNFKLWDPEMGGDGLGYPVQRVGNIGIQVTF